jgi:proline dehydrogenase
MNIEKPNLEVEVQSLGREIFYSIRRHQQEDLSITSIAVQIMQLSMRFPELKANLFRLVDVMPSLNSNKAMAAHFKEYLIDNNQIIPNFIKKYLPKKSSHALYQLAAIINRFSVNRMAKLFIAGETCSQAQAALHKILKKNLAFTVDLLGEYSMSETEAVDYLGRYLEAIKTLKNNQRPLMQAAQKNNVFAFHRMGQQQLSVSIKLSALYSQTSILNFERSTEVLSARLKTILRLAKDSAISIYLDAEDTGTNPIILAVFEQVFGSAEFIDFPYPGIVLQAYNRNCEEYIHRMLKLAQNRNNPIAVRLVKGAYWDHETIQANQNHWPNPLFEKKEDSDANYEKLSCLLLDHPELVMPAFASHNVRSLAHACTYAKSRGIRKDSFELQMLYGMADPIARAFSEKGYLVRLYVPLGEMLPGMGYLVRRLLENTSNESFLRHTFFEEAKIEELLSKPYFSESNDELQKHSTN